MSKLTELANKVLEDAKGASARPWSQSIFTQSPYGNELQKSFARGPLHNDSPRKDDQKKAWADAIYLQTATESAERLSKAVLVLKDALTCEATIVGYQLFEECGECAGCRAIAEAEKIASGE